MIRNIPVRGVLCATALSAFALVPSAFSQTTQPKPDATDKAPSALNQPATATEDPDELIVLSPFRVSEAESSTRYGVKDTLAGTRVRTDLKDVASSISVVNAQFMQDTGVKNSQDLLVYTTNTEVGGVGGNFSGVGNTFVAGISENNALLRPSQNTRVRGLDSADNTRDFFLTEIPWDGYIVDRVDLQRGPNSILFGLGSPAGIINSSLNTAGFKTRGKFENRVGSFGSVRNSLDYNQVLLRDELALRVAGLHDKTLYRQEPAYQMDKRVYAALRWDPKLLTINGAKTSIRANAEWGDIKANRPRTLPPVDKISPWYMTGEDKGIVGVDGRLYPAQTITKLNDWTNWWWRSQTNGNNLNRATIDPYYAYYHGAISSTAGGNYNTQYSFNGTNTVTDYSNWYQGYMNSGMQTNANPVLVYTANGHHPISTPFQASPQTPNGLSSSGMIDGGISGFPFARLVGIAGVNNYSLNANLDGSLSGAWKDKTMSDTSTFDFYNKLIDGDTKSEYQKWKAFNVALDQSFFNGRLAFQAVYDYQDYKDGFHHLFGQNQDVPAISIDVNSYLMDYPAVIGQGNSSPTSPIYHQTPTMAGTSPQALANPNVGRAFVASSYGSGTNQSYQSVRDTVRLLGTGELRASDFLGKSTLSDFLGRHMFTGLWSKEKQETETRSWASAAMSADYARVTGKSTLLSSGARTPDWVAYLSGDLRGTTNAGGLNLPGLSGIKVPSSGVMPVRYFDSTWNAPSTVLPGAAWINPYQRPVDDNGGVQGASTQSENPANYVGWRTVNFKILSADKDKDLLYLDGSKVKRDIDSAALTYQGFFWDGAIVPTIGWRRDTLKQRAGNAPIIPETGSANMVFAYDDKVTKVSGESTSWGLVLHTPKSLRKNIPLGTSMDLFANQSENTRVETRYGFHGGSLPNSKGKTTDYGFAINTLNDKVQLKVTWYETKVTDAAMGTGEFSALGNKTYLAYQLEQWTTGRALCSIGTLATIGTAGPTVPTDTQGYVTPSSGWSIASWSSTRAQILAHPVTAHEIASVKAALATQLSQEVYDAYGMKINRDTLAALNVDGLIAGTVPLSSFVTADGGNYYINGIDRGYWPTFGTGGVGDMQTPGRGRVNGTYPIGTTDTTSKGIEFELNAQPFRNLNIAINASKTKATRTKVGTEVMNALESKYRKWVGSNPKQYQKDIYVTDTRGEVARFAYNKATGTYLDSTGAAMGGPAVWDTLTNSVKTAASWGAYTAANPNYDKGTIVGRVVSKVSAGGVNVTEGGVNYQQVQGSYYDVMNPTASGNYNYIAAPTGAEAGDIRMWWYGGQAVRNDFLTGLWFPYQYALQTAELKSEAPELNPWRFNLVSNLSFDEKFVPVLNGVTIGGAVRWQQGNILGYYLNDDGVALDPTRPIRGDSQTSVDMWVSYSRKLTKKLDWRIQVNVREVGKDVRLIPIAVNPDGSVATSRIAEGMTWQLTNTFSF